MGKWIPTLTTLLGPVWVAVSPQLQHVLLAFGTAHPVLSVALSFVALQIYHFLPHPAALPPIN